MLVVEPIFFSWLFPGFVRSVTNTKIGRAGRGGPVTVGRRTFGVGEQRSAGQASGRSGKRDSAASIARIRPSSGSPAVCDEQTAAGQVTGWAAHRPRPRLSRTGWRCSEVSGPIPAGVVRSLAVSGSGDHVPRRRAGQRGANALCGGVAALVIGLL